ncbi:MAG: IclR family transcriptional regulator [Opitutaceae bacterium]
MNDKTEQRYCAPALEKGLDILEFLASEALPCSKSEIGEALERKPSEIYRMLCVLEERGYVQKQEGTTAYSLSLKLFELSHLQSNISTLRKAVRAPMEQLANQIGEACHFSIQNGTNILVTMERMPARRVCLAVGEGTTFPLTQAASGSVQLSLMEDHEIENLLQNDEHYSKLSATKQNAYLKHIKQVRANHYEIAKSQISPGVIDIAVPIGIPKTDLCGTLAVSQLGSDLDSKTIQKNLSAIQTCAQLIHRALGI